MDKILAIVIPAYKPDYLKCTLESIENQTNNNFTLYIGDDNSPFNLSEIIDKFSDKIHMVYHRFNTNMGNMDLNSQWERCIELTKKEEWLWLFSDDDIMQTNCVQKFYDSIRETNSKYDLYRYNTLRIDMRNTAISEPTKHPQWETCTGFLNRKMLRQTNSYAVEYIFNRKIYERKAGFVKFPCAWASDDATWALFAIEKGIFTIKGALVKWRYSGQNLSCNQDPLLSKQKLDAVIQFINWSNQTFSTAISDKVLLNWALFQLSLMKGLNLSTKIGFTSKIILRTHIRIKMLFFEYLRAIRKRFRRKTAIYESI